MTQLHAQGIVAERPRRGTRLGAKPGEPDPSNARDAPHARIAELETILLVTSEAHDRRVSELLEANNAMRDERTAARTECTTLRTIIASIGRDLVKAQTERDNGLVLLEEMAGRLNRIEDETMALDEGTEDPQHGL